MGMVVQGGGGCGDECSAVTDCFRTEMSAAIASSLSHRDLSSLETRSMSWSDSAENANGPVCNEERATTSFCSWLIWSISGLSDVVGVGECMCWCSLLVRVMMEVS